VTELLPNLLAGRVQRGTGSGTALFDPVLGHELVRVDSTGLDLAEGFAFARDKAGPALRAMSYAQRGAMLAAIGNVLRARREEYYDISTANSGTVRNDTAVDVDGAIYTIDTYAKLSLREPLGDRRFLLDGESVRLGKDPLFQSQHVLVPSRGVALFINAFNFPAWGLWEKAAPALLSGVPVIVKPATATAWLTQRMVLDVNEAGILPPGALSVVCGSSVGLLDQLQPFDVVSFTGSADTAALIRSHPALTRASVRANIEADSINSAVLLTGETVTGEAFELLVKEVTREIVVKAGQKCTAIRRVFVPQSLYKPAAEAIAARLAKTIVGNPRNDAVRMGSLVSRAQLASVHEGIASLKQKASLLHDGATHTLVDADPHVGCFVGPTLFGSADPDATPEVHDLEVFGPVATLMPYRDAMHARALVRSGQGSLVVSLFGHDAVTLASEAAELADSHGRVHVVSPEVGSSHTGHGNVMPQSLHGGPGRAGGGEELGGARALNFYHRRAAVQASSAVLSFLS
jgi:3,4-dehydroadipyl-CoA semialdehyde dehydrogenase